MVWYEWYGQLSLLFGRPTKADPIGYQIKDALENVQYIIPTIHIVKILLISFFIIVSIYFLVKTIHKLADFLNLTRTIHPLIKRSTSKCGRFGPKVDIYLEICNITQTIHFDVYLISVIGYGPKLVLMGQLLSHHVSITTRNYIFWYLNVQWEDTTLFFGTTELKLPKILQIGILNNYLAYKLKGQRLQVRLIYRSQNFFTEVTIRPNRKLEIIHDPSCSEMIDQADNTKGQSLQTSSISLNSTSNNDNTHTALLNNQNSDVNETGQNNVVRYEPSSYPGYSSY